MSTPTSLDKAGYPRFKIYYRKEYRASFKHLQDAAVMVAHYGTGAIIKWGRYHTLWTNGADGDCGGPEDEEFLDKVNARIAELIETGKIFERPIKRPKNANVDLEW